MKTSTILLLGAGVGALVLLTKARKAGVGDDDMLVPPPGRTITSSGQVLGGLGLETRFIDSYDANPSQYRRQVINDMVPGLGRPQPGAGRAFSFGAGIAKLNKDREEAAAREKARLAEKQRQIEMEALAQRKVNETLAAIQKKAEEDMIAQQKAEEGRQAAAANAEAERQAAIKAADALRWQTTMAQQDQTLYSQASGASSSTPAGRSNYDQAKQAYDAVQAAREQASMSQASSDTGYGRTSDDSGYGSTQQVTEEGAPQIPERITQVQTPAAQVLPQEAAPAPTGNSKVGLIVGGGVLAAIAAALAS